MIGQTLGNYEITATLGKGGMGEVYRARDTKLGREVAIKVLPKEMSGDPERAARFEREARTLASLQHANIASIYGFENANGIQFLAMELVEGQNLQDRLAAGPIPQDEVLRIARQMAIGLEAAHDKGIVHRDLKPANVMLTPDGDVKILDFGLARAWFGDAGDDGDIAASPTITAAMTQAGTILGTAAYMSPEQARGKNVDRRADIWAFGVILWEMLTGERLFEGETVSDTLAAVLRAEPDWSMLPYEEHPLLCRLIERCLTRDPRQRLRDVGEARIALEDPDTSLTSFSVLAAPATPAAEQSASKPPFVAMLLIGLLFSALGVGIGWKLLATAPEAQLLHTMIPGPADLEFQLGGSNPGPIALSPNGKMLTFAAIDENGISVLYLRHLDQSLPSKLSGTEGAAYPFWSPDSDFVAFFSASGDQKLKKVSINGSPPVTLCPADNGKGGTWNADGTILFTPDSSSPIHRVSSIGGEPVAITKLVADENSHRHPRFLPDGEQYLFLARGSGGSGAFHTVRLGSLSGDSTRVITQSQSQAEYSEGHLLTIREAVLLATPFDISSGQLTGGATPLVENVLVIGSNAAAGVYTTSVGGLLSFQTGSSSDARVLEWVDMETGESVQLPTEGRIFYPKISPDGERCVVEMWDEGYADLWMVDLGTGLSTRFTFAEGSEIAAVWTPDSRSVIYTSTVVGSSATQILQASVDGTGGAAILYEADFEIQGSGVSPDGRYLYVHYVAEQGYDTARIPLDTDGELEVVLATDENEGGARISPNGKWMAFNSSSGNRWDVYVMPVDGGRRKWQVSTNGAVWARWKPDGSEIYVSEFGGQIAAYAVRTDGDTFELGPRRVIGEADPPAARGSRTHSIRTVRDSFAPGGIRTPDPKSRSFIS